MEIVFVACVHLDPRGHGKLLKLISLENPTHIFVELSPWGLFFRKTRHRILLDRLRGNLKKAARALDISYDKALSHPSIKAIIARISTPYEFRAAYLFSRSRPCFLTLVDSSLFSFKHTSGWHELVCEANLRQLLKQDPPSLSAQVAFEYRLAREAFQNASRKEGKKTDLSGDGTAEERERDIWLCNQLLLQLSIFSPLKSVYIGGWRHFLPNTYFMQGIKTTPKLRRRTILLSDSRERILPTGF